MQWMITYGLRPESSWRDYDGNVAGLLACFADWTPPEGVEIVTFVHRADAKGGWMLVESDDVAGPSEIVAQYLAFHDAEIFPVLPAVEMAQRLGGTMAWRAELVNG
jgi:hypothetical protein